jgi:hypothetical protein
MQPRGITLIHIPPAFMTEPFATSGSFLQIHSYFQSISLPLYTFIDYTCIF